MADIVHDGNILRDYFIYVIAYNYITYNKEFVMTEKERTMDNQSLNRRYAEICLVYAIF